MGENELTSMDLMYVEFCMKKVIDDTKDMIVRSMDEENKFTYINENEEIKKVLKKVENIQKQKVKNVSTKSK